MNWNDLRSEMSECDSLKKMYDNAQCDRSFDEMIDETVSLWECMCESEPEDYANNVRLWEEEFGWVLDNFKL